MNPVIATMLLSGIIFFGGFKMKQKKIKVLMVEPGKNPIETELSNDGNDNSSYKTRSCVPPMGRTRCPRCTSFLNHGSVPSLK